MSLAEISVDGPRLEGHSGRHRQRPREGGLLSRWMDDQNQQNRNLNRRTQHADQDYGLEDGKLSEGSGFSSDGEFGESGTQGVQTTERVAPPRKQKKSLV